MAADRLGDGDRWAPNGSGQGHSETDLENPEGGAEPSQEEARADGSVPVDAGSGDTTLLDEQPEIEADEDAGEDPAGEDADWEDAEGEAAESTRLSLHPRLMRILRTLCLWRSPPDQPLWARPALLSIAAIAAVIYAWGIENFPLEPFYAAAARSMGSNWHDFFFGAVDPMGTTTLDKLPGAFWIQALFVRVFGFHYWVVCVPQVIAGILTVLVLYRAVCRVVGPAGGLIAAGLLTVSPAVAILNRGNVSDPFLVLLTVLAADAALRATQTGRLRSLLLCGLWVGLAFQTKMVQAWLVLPAVFTAYLVAAPPRLRKRALHVAAVGVTVLVVSLSWMSAVSLVPAHDRPFVDGTSDDSVFTQVFVYNGLIRVDRSLQGMGLEGPPATFLVTASKHVSPVVGTSRIGPSWHRLLSGPLGHDAGWLLPASLVAAVGVLVERGRRRRRDLARAAVILWSVWLVVLFGFFSSGSLVNSYYIGALMPAVCGLCAIGSITAWRHRGKSPWLYALLAATAAATAGYDALLVPSGAGIAWWLGPLALLGGLGAVAVCLDAVLRPRGTIGGTRAWLSTLTATVLVPAIVTVTVPLFDLGSFSSPLETTQATRGLVLRVQSYQTRGLSYGTRIDSEYPPGSIVIATDSSQLADPLIMLTGREYLPIGGFFGGDPSPSLATLERDVHLGRIHYFLVPLGPAKDPRIRWVRAHCRQLDTLPDGPAVRLANYACDPPAGLVTSADHTQLQHGEARATGRPLNPSDSEPTPSVATGSS